MDDDQSPSLDDALEEERTDDGIPVGNNPLPEDNQTPAAPSDSPTELHIPQDHQVLDTNMDGSEVYEESNADAAEVGEKDSTARPENS